MHNDNDVSLHCVYMTYTQCNELYVLVQDSYTVLLKECPCVLCLSPSPSIKTIFRLNVMKSV